nr:ribosomal protein L2, plastid [Ipomoea batatas]
MPTFVNKPDVDLSKIKALNDINYHRWSAKMLIHFDSMEMDYVLIEDHVLYQAPAQTTLTQHPQPESLVQFWMLCYS